MNEFDKLFYTARELRDIEAGAAAYDRRQEEELRQEAATLHHHDGGDELHRVIEKDRFEHLAFLHEEIAELGRVRERFPGNSFIQQMAEHQIRVRQTEIETIVEEIHERRKETAAEKL